MLRMAWIGRVVWVLARLGDGGDVDIVLALGVARVDVGGGDTAWLLWKRALVSTRSEKRAVKRGNGWSIEDCGGQRGKIGEVERGRGKMYWKLRHDGCELGWAHQAGVSQVLELCANGVEGAVCGGDVGHFGGGSGQWELSRRVLEMLKWRNWYSCR